ncbi:hypothetical protein JHD47_08510, partial [Sulfurimonas sp. SAG-AH-194-L11]
KLKGELRPRFEAINQDQPNTIAGSAFTNRMHLSATAALLGIENLSATIGLQSVNNFGYTNYSSPGNSVSDGDGNTYNVIADAQLAMLSEASIDYKLANSALHLGRSQLNLDNQRFIGTVGWRQQERSYDTAYLANSDIENLDLLAAYVYGYAGVTGVTTTETNSVILHAKYKVNDALNITTYGYLLASLSDTYGLTLAGKFNASKDVKLSYRAEYAIQIDATMEYGSAANQTNVKADANYLNLDLATNISGLIAGLNYEVLSGTDENDASSTKTQFNPALGTNHKFNGWADVFYVGNNGAAGGLIDSNIRLGYKAKGFGKLLAVYHDFQAQTAMNAVSGTTINLGSEIDVVYVNKIPGVSNLSGLLKFASYTAGDATSFSNATFDKQVAWAQLSYKF